jgi:hypothetical protein
MKDMVRSRSEGLIQKHPKLFNIFLILALISLVVAGAFLLSDIMSFKSNAAQKGPFSAFSLKIPNESQTTMVKTWQEKGVNLIGQLKSILGTKGPAKDLDKDSTRDKARALLAKNRLAKAKEARLRTENLSHQEIPTGLSNSSRALTSVQPSQSTSAFMMSSGESEDGSDSSYYSEGDSSSKDTDNDPQFGAVTSNIGENQLPSNESVLNGSVSNDSVIGDSILKESATDEPVVNDSVSNNPVIGDSILKESAMDEPVVNESMANESVSNDSVLNEPIMNEPVANKSAINDSTLNESEVESQMGQSNTNQSQMYTNSSSNTSKSLTVTDQGTNGTGNNSYPLDSRNTNISFDKLSSELQTLPESNPNFAASNSTEPHDSVDQERNGSAASATPEFNKMNNEISNQNETSNLLTNSNIVQDEMAKKGSQYTILDQKNNTTSDVLASSSKNIPPNSVPDKTSNISSGQVTESFEGQSNFAPTGKTFLANNSTSQFQEPKQTYNQSESKPRLDKPSTPLNPLSNNKTEGLQNNTVKNTGNNKKKISTNSSSAKSQQSKIGQTNSASRFRTLKVPTPSWMTKA